MLFRCLFVCVTNASLIGLVCRRSHLNHILCCITNTVMRSVLQKIYFRQFMLMFVAQQPCSYSIRLSCLVDTYDWIRLFAKKASRMKTHIQCMRQSEDRNMQECHIKVKTICDGH